MPEYLPFEPHPRAPRERLPALSCDAQFHVFGPRDRYPVRAGAAYEMPTATWEAARALHTTLGIQRGVIVQATTYGADHQVVLDALAALNGGGQRRYVGCANAAVMLERDDAHLELLHEAGVRGVRFTRGGLGIHFDGPSMDRALGRIRELGWYVKLQPEPNGVSEQLRTFEHIQTPLVIDHMGRPDPTRGDSDTTLQDMLRLLERDNAWVMLSLSEKISRAGAPWDDVIPLARKLIEAAPDRCVWGSDWPHPLSTKQPPNEGDLLDLLYRFAPDEQTRRLILVDNPARLFGFDRTSTTAAP